MKKYKQVVAALLAMNLTVYVMPTGVVNISAAVESQGNEDTTEEVQTNSEENTDAVSAEEDLGSDTDTSDNTENTEAPAADTTDAAEITDENVNNNGDTTNAEPSGDAASSEEQGIDDLFSDGTQQDTATAAAATEQPEEISEVETQASNAGTIELEQLARYDASTKTMTISSNDELILLSNCDQAKVADININFVSVGQVDVTATAKIPAGKDISQYFKDTASTASSEEDQPADVSQTEDTEPADSEEVQETENQDVADTADIQDTDTAENDENTTPAEDSAESTETAEDASQNVATQSTVIALRDYTYQGIGDADHPFQGTISGTTSEIFKIDNSLFGGLSSKAKITTTKKIITWCGNDETPMLAKVYQFDSTPEEGQDSHTIPVDKIQGDSSATMGSLIGTVKASASFETQVLKIGADTVTYGSNVKATSSSGNSGLICETLESGTICLDGYVFPENYTVQSTATYTADETNAPAAGNAGGVIGVMKTGTTLDIQSAITIKDAKITSDKGNAGGIVGLMQQGAVIKTEAAATLDNPTITGGATAGGVAGWAVNTTFADSDITAALTVKTPTITASASGASAGGFAGKYTLETTSLGDAATLTFPEQVTIDTPILTVNNEGLAGGYFGHLDLNGNLTYTIGGTDSNTKKEVRPTYTNCSARALGAVVGKVTNNVIAGTLIIQNMQTTATKNSDNGVNYHGGLVGELGDHKNNAQAAYLKVSNCDINVVYPHVSERDENGFGGIVGMLASGSILRTENTVKITTPDSNIKWGGGVAGYAEKSVIDLSGTTDLSGVSYEANRGKNAQAGWLVGKQDCALIYAEGDGNGHGWSYIRGKENTSGKTAMNDIGNYGQIIRLHSDEGESQLSSNLISISEDHTVNYAPSTPATLNGDTIEIGSTDAFAMLSITWNSRGCFGEVTGSTNADFSTKNITLSADINLTGSGIAGLTRDTYSNEDTYYGTFDGGNHIVTLATGETFGYKQNATDTLASEEDYGYGEVISAGARNHGRQGLFAKVIRATVKNVTINGKINISNTEQDMLAGGIAGELVGNGNLGNPTVISGVTAEEKITVDCSNKTGGIMVGGLLGGIYDNSPALQLGEFGVADTLNTVAAEINLKNCTSDTDETKINAGGVVGEVGESPFTFTVNSLTVKGSITTSADELAYIGGLIGIIKGRNDDSVNHQIQIKSVTFDTFKINAPKATKICGGLFGSIWTNVGVYFMGKDDTDNGTDTKLKVLNSEINAPKAEYVGGLAYRSSGNWEIRDHGIDLQSLTINAGKNVGLLVCRGEKANEYMAGADKKRELGALYLSTTKYWDSSYKISTDNVSITTADNSGVFDEFVAYTSNSSGEITQNGKNGVISIATQEDGNGRVGVDKSECTTYKNRTTYGQTHPTNACSRYYYDLDQCLTDMTTGSAKNYNKDGKIDTPQELLLWSVYNYACANIGKFFTRPELSQNEKITDIMWDDTTTQWIIGDNDLDMQKYSYYPIDYSGLSVCIRNTTVKFWNEEIETAETNAANKSTQGGEEDDHTQHYTMHCGLFLTFKTAQTALIVDTVTFAGSIGKVNNSNSGVLVAKSATGYVDENNNTPQIVTVKIYNTTFDGLKVSNYKDPDYAPLLINSIGQYLTLDVNNITTRIKDSDGNEKSSYTEGTAVASSLIGWVGSQNARQINLSFLNVILPDKKAGGTEGIFSHATLLEFFAYAKDDVTSSAAYNFYNGDDWSGDNHIHKVTYGKEITETTEFTDLQKWYYDEDTYHDPSGLVYDDVTNKDGFSSAGYLPYVCTAYNEEKCTHEIKVNQRVTDIVHGCGTYGHPYQITSAEEMKILADYMATGNPTKDWRVTVTKNQATYHVVADNSDTDVTYQYNGSVWVQVKNNKTADGKDNWQDEKDSNGNNITIDKDFMYQYLLNAYYDIQGKTSTSETGYHLKLTDFGGFGTRSNPFRGVLTSSTNVTITLSGSSTSNGLIPYSYGSVIRKLNIVYSGTGKTLTYSDKSSTKYAPDVFFGGVIGCVMGGDNIIDGVTVTMDNNWLTLDGDKKHLIQVGGYVGSVSGGGVIFRNLTDGNGLTDANITNVSGILDKDTFTNLYVNPYVGRVLDGFAFYEKTSTDENVRGSLTNTDKNYTINTLTDKNCVSMSDNTVTVNDAQGLLILSAIINSGAASKGISYSYSNIDNTSYTTSDKSATYSFGGAYGKVRNADYTAVGDSVTNAEEKLSQSDDKTTPGGGSLPYLIQKYCGAGAGVFSISSNSNVEINLKSGGDFDMAGYGNGYQGITARYVSNTVRGGIVNEDNREIVSNHSEVIVPEVKKFNGNGNTVTMNMQVREYADDDFHAASVGGMFNVLRVSGDGTLSNLKIKPNAKKEAPSVSLTYYNAQGNPASINSEWENSEEIGVGGFAGSLVGYTSEYANRDITVEKIELNSLTLNSPASVGGIFGNTGKPVKNNEPATLTANDIANLLQPQTYQIAYGIAFNDCNYSGLNATGKYAAGGFVGYLGNQEQNPRSSVNGDGGTLSTTNTGESSAISATDSSSWAGGLFGYVGTRMFINMTQDGIKRETQAILQDVSVNAGTVVGGCIGYINGKCYGIHNVSVKGTGTSAVKISLPEKTPTGTYYAGGIIGWAKGAAQEWASNWSYAGGVSGSSVKNVEINDANKATSHDYIGPNGIQTNYIAGGIVGQTAGGSTRIEGCTVTNSKVYGSVAGGITGRTDSEMQFVSCAISGTSEKKTELKGFSTAGGILGFWTGGNAATIQDCAIQYLDIEGKDWGVGAWIGDADGSGVGTLYLFNSSAQDSNVTASGNKNSGGGRWPCVGGIIGNLRNTIKASNVLFSNMTLDSTKGSYSGATNGLLFGNVTTGGDIAVNIAGISIQNIPDANKNLPLTGGGKVDTNNDYIAFADYSGTALDDSKKGNSTDLLVDDSTNDVAAPYVVTSPKNSTLKLYESESSETPQYLYGDGAHWSSVSGDGVEAKEIWDNRTAVTGGHYAYKKINEVVSDFKFDSAISTYSANNPTTQSDSDSTDSTTQSDSDNTDQTTPDDTENTDQTTQGVEDFPVIQIGVGSADTVKDYLNILTNGAFSAANSMNTASTKYVTAKVDVYQEENGKFVKQENAKPTFTASTDSAGKITFSTTTGYDNGEKRFNLLTVTFTEKDADKNEHHYNVQIPVLVRRMLEINFSATLTYGTNFREENYKDLKSHVLESFGSSITAYLKYTYNSDENGDYTEYGWQSYIDAGGDVSIPMQRELCFKQGNVNLPTGTQLSLVDCRDGKVYYYTVKNPTQNIDLTAFKDSDGNAYNPPSIAELMQATATSTTDGTFIKVDENGKPNGGTDDKNYPSPTVRLWNSNTSQYEYYRRAESGEKGNYTITVNESNLKDSKGKSTVSESYYLVITVPKDSTSDPLNGSLQTSIKNSGIANQIHYKTIQGGDDDHNNKASTYLISKGYQQKLYENKNQIEYDMYRKMSAENNIMKVDVVDEITFPNGQAYLDAGETKDELYQRFVGSLQKTIGDNTSAEQFPSGTTGTANFYVYKKDGNTTTYYQYDRTNKTWKDVGTNETVATSYTWTSDGGNMELPLADETIDNVISLQGVRALVRNGNDGNSTFYVEVRMDAAIPAAGLDVIPESQEIEGVPQDYVKFAYSSQLSTEKTSLSYSTNRATVNENNTKTAYYREEPEGAKLTYDADQLGQLGINLLDLQYLDTSEQHSLIDTTALYDLSSMKNLDNALKNSTGIKFTLNLSPKNTGSADNQEDYQAATTNADQYLSVELKSKDSGSVDYKNGTWTWTVPKETYWDGNSNNVKTDSVFDGSILTQAIQLKVNVDNIEDGGIEHFYSNYKVTLKAEILEGNNPSVGAEDDNIIYTLAKIKPEFVEPSSTN